MYYHPDFLPAAWADYATDRPLDQIDPDAFVRWTYARALAHRQPLYAAMARNWGLSVTAEDIARVNSAAEFDALIARTLEARA
jgi:hypothetical protein